ncbi:lysophospholipid acyltransferase family protein [Bowmanella pacifica]|nr:lysophospholipid acyltransferase family protein [Bowmanella pacifica]
MQSSLNMPPIGDKVPRIGSRFTFWLGCKVLSMKGWRMEGEFPNLDKMVACVAPHTSNWDFVIGLATAFALRLRVSFLGKHSLFKGPLGWWMRKIGGIPVERSAPQGLVQQVADVFARQDMVLGVAPEGTRKKVENWKSGFLHIAKAANVPVLLIYLDYKKKVIGFGPLLEIGDDIAVEMAKIREFYAGVTAKYPELA